VSRNGDGIVVSGSANTIVDNDIARAVGCPDGCGYGISMEAGEDTLIARNVILHAQHDGIRIAAFDPAMPTINTIVRANWVRDAKIDAFSVATEGDGTVSATLLERNKASDSGDDGFDVRSAATVMTSNLAVRNADLGIEAVLGVTDGGGNRARANGNPQQCIGVAC
jgi:hypothetical protein